MFKNMFFYGNSHGGFFRAIVFFVIALIILGYLGFNIQNILESPLVKKNLDYAWNFVKTVWVNFLKKPAEFVWDKIIVGLVWDGINKLINLIPKGTS